MIDAVTTSLDDTGVGQTCSRAGCRAPAEWNVNWRNPRIHDVDRVKIWRACQEHVDYLRGYLSARDFPVLITPAGTIIDRVEDP